MSYGKDAWGSLTSAKFALPIAYSFHSPYLKVDFNVGPYYKFNHNWYPLESYENITYKIDNDAGLNIGMDFSFLNFILGIEADFGLTPIATQVVSETNHRKLDGKVNAFSFGASLGVRF